MKCSLYRRLEVDSRGQAKKNYLGGSGGAEPPQLRKITRGGLVGQSPPKLTLSDCPSVVVFRFLESTELLIKEFELRIIDLFSVPPDHGQPHLKKSSIFFSVPPDRGSAAAECIRTGPNRSEQV